MRSPLKGTGLLSEDDVSDLSDMSDLSEPEPEEDEDDDLTPVDDDEEEEAGEEEEPEEEEEFAEEVEEVEPERVDEFEAAKKEPDYLEWEAVSSAPSSTLSSSADHHLVPLYRSASAATTGRPSPTDTPTRTTATR